MKWTVLSDNRRCDDSLEIEHGLSILLETEKHHILLDTGASDVFIRNAERLCIDLSTVDYVFISHGHSDHAGGLQYIVGRDRKAKVLVSPDAMSGKFYSKRGNLHSITAEWPKIDDDRLILIDQTCTIAEDIHVIAHIPQNHPMPKGNVNLYVQNTAGEPTEQREPSSSLEWPSRDGSRRSQTEEELTVLAQRLKAKYPNTQFYTSHCTGDKVFATLKTIMGNQLQAFSCGMTVTV